jgi:hypothetical protein
VDQETRTGARASLSAMTATLLACVGAALIAGAPDWISRMALAKRPLAVFGMAQDTQDPKSPTKDGITIAGGRGSAQPQLAGAIHSPPPALDVVTLDDQLDLEHSIVDPSCDGGAPRFPRADDLDGDGVSGGNAPLYVGDPPGSAGCDAGRSRVEDPTEDIPRSSYDLVTVDNRTLEDGQDTAH